MSTGVDGDHGRDSTDDIQLRKGSVSLMNSQTKQPSRSSLLKRDVDDDNWAEVAQFNQLLDQKIRLDEVAEARRKANMQKQYLETQLQEKRERQFEPSKEKKVQAKQMQNLIDQVAKDKTDLKNRETLKHMQEKAARINAVNYEKRRREEEKSLELVDRQQILYQQNQDDAGYRAAQEARKAQYASSLK